MTSEIKEWIKSCETCQEYDNTQTKETLMSHDVPDRPWQKVGVDFFSYKEKDYLVTNQTSAGKLIIVQVQAQSL